MAQYKNFPSIDDMIVAGKTLPEIQAELRKVIAVRDEAALKVQKDLAIRKARATAAEKLADYLVALDVPCGHAELVSTFEKTFKSYEEEIGPALKTMAKNKSIEPTATLDESALESALATLRNFADSL